MQATERLRFIRDYYPPYYNAKPSDLANPKNGHPYFQGMSPSSALDFANEYHQYQLDREAFIARRPNYGGLIDAIVQANAKIVTATPAEALAAADGLITLTGTIKTSITTITGQQTAAADSSAAPSTASPTPSKKKG